MRATEEVADGLHMLTGTVLKQASFVRGSFGACRDEPQKRMLSPILVTSTLQVQSMFP